MKVRIDGERCQGHQMCAIAAPEVFGSDMYGNAVSRRLGGGDLGRRTGARPAHVSGPVLGLIPFGLIETSAQAPQSPALAPQFGCSACGFQTRTQLDARIDARRTL